MPIRIPNWAALPDGVITTIAKLLEPCEFISFRGTCNSWRSATSYKDFQKEWCPGLPFLMLNRVKDCAGDNRGFFNFYKGKVISISISEIRDKLCIGTKGWLITVDSSGELSLLNPITRVEIRLPKISDDSSYCWVKRGVLSASPTITSDYVVVIVYLKSPKQSNYLGFWKPGDPAWTKFDELENVVGEIRDVSFHNGVSYVLSYARKVWKLDVFGTDPIISIDLPGDIIYCSTYYEAFLVEYGGTLLVVSSFHKLHRDCCPHRVFELVELDFINGTCKKITSLGEYAVFIGNNEGFCIDAMRLPGVIRANHIYQSNGSYQIAGCEDRADISPKEKVGMFYSDTYSNPSGSNFSNVWVTPNL